MLPFKAYPNKISLNSLDFQPTHVGYQKKDMRNNEGENLQVFFPSTPKPSCIEYNKAKLVIQHQCRDSRLTAMGSDTLKRTAYEIQLELLNQQ